MRYMLVWLVVAITTGAARRPLPQEASRRAEMLRPLLISYLPRGGDSPTHEIIHEEVLHDSWRKLILRRVKIHDVTVEYEIVGQKGTDEAVLIFVWNTTDSTATIIREYMPSLHRRQFGLAAGMVEHESTEAAARAELAEEAGLEGGSWTLLTPVPVVMDKYATTRLSVFLCLNPVTIPLARRPPRDAEEADLEVICGVSRLRLEELILDGRFTVVGAWATHLALSKLDDILFTNGDR